MRVSPRCFLCADSVQQPNEVSAIIIVILVKKKQVQRVKKLA